MIVEPRQKPVVRRSELARDLEAAGLKAGDVVVVHSALRQVGWIEGGPREVVLAFMDVLGRAGTLLMPTFSFNLASWNLPAFDPWRTASRVGRLTETFRRMPGVARSHHPTHSVAGWGRLGHQLVSGPLDYEALGVGSPLDRARRAGAKVLLIGVGQTRNSTVHVAESLAAMEYLRVTFMEGGSGEPAWYLDEPEGRPRKLVLREVPGSSEGFAILDEVLVRQGVARRVRIGSADSQIMDSQALCDEVVNLLREDPTVFLRDENASEISRRRRDYMHDLLEHRRR